MSINAHAIADEHAAEVTHIESQAFAAVAAKKREFKPSHHQARFFGWVEGGSGHAILKAVAGSGKSTSIVRALPFIPATKQVLILAFNAPIAKEMREKIAALEAEMVERGACQPGRFRNVDASTFHARGFKALCRRWGKDVKVEVDSGKVRKILKDRLSEREYEFYGDFVFKLVGFAKGVGFGIKGVGPAIEDAAAWREVIATQDMYLNDEDATEERAIDVAQKALRVSNHKAKEERWIDFDDQLYLPLLWDLRLFPHDWVLVDEAQDTNPVRREFARRSLRRDGRSVWVGDPCQPAGTLVTMADGVQVPIENLKIGDKVRSFSSIDASFVQSGRRVNGITKKLYNGQMTTVKSDGVETRYTANHYCYALLSGLADKWCVYAMRKGPYWRVGTTKMQQAGGVLGLSSRRRIERADDIWMLATFDTERAAKTYEFKIATEYGVPELLFHAPGKIGTAAWLAFQEAIDLAWASLDASLLYHRAKSLLEDHGRDIAYSFNELATTGIACITRPMKIRASNFMDGMAVLHYSGKAHYDRSMFRTITVSRKSFFGDVWSLDVEKDHTYIADGIATFNCQSIYGFTGASHDAMEHVAEQFGTAELPLTVSYRCPRAVGEHARELVEYFETAPGAIEGEVETLGLKDALAKLGPRDAILCRKTAPLVDLAFKLIAEGRGCRVLGKEVGAGLIALIKKQKARGVDALIEKLAAWLEREVEKLLKDDRAEKAEALSDRVASVRVVAAALPEAQRTIPGVIAKIESLFGEDGSSEPLLSLSTIHKAKGREYKRVVLYGPEMIPSKAAKTEEAFQQELNLLYVAYTRAMESLYLVQAEERRR